MGCLKDCNKPSETMKSRNFLTGRENLNESVLHEDHESTRYGYVIPNQTQKFNDLSGMSPEITKTTPHSTASSSEHSTSPIYFHLTGCDVNTVSNHCCSTSHLIKPTCATLFFCNSTARRGLIVTREGVHASKHVAQYHYFK